MSLISCNECVPPTLIRIDAFSEHETFEQYSARIERRRRLSREKSLPKETLKLVIHHSGISDLELDLITRQIK